jgi:DNA-binding NarL/FixJ family response regulator
MRIVVADDEASVRSALRLLLEQDLRVTAIIEVAAAESLLVQAEATRPDVVLVDWDLPGLHTGHVLSALRSVVSHPAVIALSSRPDERRAALAEGVDAFVCKGDAPEQLLLTLVSQDRGV